MFRAALRCEDGGTHFDDALVELVPGHRLLKEGPAELGLVVDVRDLGDLLGRRRCETEIFLSTIGTRAKEGPTKLGRKLLLKLLVVLLEPEGRRESVDVRNAARARTYLSSRVGAMVKKSHPASSSISPVCAHDTLGSKLSLSIWEHRASPRTLRKEAPMTMVL